jgi:hypothetical protein
MSIFKINPFEQLEKMRNAKEAEKRQKIIDNMKKYFSAEDEYIIEQNVGGGIQASAFRVKRTAPGSSNYDRIVVKVPNAPLASGTENDERDVLLTLRGAAHVVRHIDIPNNPDDSQVSDDSDETEVTQKSGGSSELPADGWIYMEWLENGTLGDFLSRINTNKKPLPNRLIWRLYMCCKTTKVSLWKEQKNPN